MVAALTQPLLHNTVLWLPGCSPGCVPVQLCAATTAKTENPTLSPGFSPALSQGPQAGLCWHQTGTLTQPKLLCTWGQDVPLQGSERTRGNVVQSHVILRGIRDLLLGLV